MQSILAYWTMRFCGGLAVLVASGLGAPSAFAERLFPRTHWFLLDLLCGIAGFAIAFTAVTPLVRVLGTSTRLRRQWGAAAHAEFARSSTAQRVFLLLLAVAEADGSSGPAERELVRAFLLSRFVDVRQRAEIDAWAATLRPPRDVTELARMIARELEPGERGTIYSWSCLVAFADGALRAEEFRVLQQVATGLGVAPHHALFLFEFAQQAARRQQRPASASRNGRPQAPPPPPPPRGTPRERALATLGLPPDATRDAIRHRHRELVRRFHPDAHRTLGPVAQREATERFLAIQRAYEELGG